MESATLDIPAPSRNANLRTYLAGGGATAALVAAAVTVFLGVAAFVGFNGIPFGADEGAGATVNLAAGAPEAAALAAAPTAGAVAAAPTAPSAAALAEILAALPPGAPIPGLPGITTTGTGTGTLPPGVIDPPDDGPAPTPGALGNAVSGLEDTAAGLGLDLPLGDLTDGVTGPLDKTINDTLNNAGGGLGNPKLGNQVNGTLNETTNGLLNP